MKISKRLLEILGVLILFPSWGLGAEKASPFILTDLEGGTFSLEKEVKKGKGPLVFDFWATWCKPCIKSLGKMQKLADDYQKKGVRVYSINIDGPRSQAKIRPFLKRYKLALPVLLDPNNQVMQLYHFFAPPVALIVDSAGQLVYKHQGYKPGDEKKWEAALDQLLDDQTKTGQQTPAALKENNP